MDFCCDGERKIPMKTQNKPTFLGGNREDQKGEVQTSMLLNNIQGCRNIEACTSRTLIQLDA